MTIYLKKSEKINLKKKETGLGEISINLNWNSTPKNQGLLGSLFGSNGGIDLDLACLYELKNGEKNAVQALGNSFGRLNRPPYIALDGDELVFVEVKYRASSRYGSPMEAVDYRKQNKIYMVANYYLMEQHISKYTKVRYDVVGILGKEITLIKNAFGGM